MAKRNCELKGLWWVPQERCGNFTLLERHLTFNPRWYDKNEPRPDPVITTIIDEQNSRIGLPVDWGMKHYPDDDYINSCSEGTGRLIARKMPDPYHPSASPGQPKFIQDLNTHFETNHYCLANAPTGSGKTVSALSVAATLGLRTLIVTDRTYLGFKQWMPQAMDKLGLPREEIGIIQGQQCDYKKSFVVGIAKSLTENKYPDKVYDAFGFIIFDEIHKFAAPTLAMIAPQFHAQNNLAMSATTERRDGAEVLIKNHFGDVAVQGEGQALKCFVRVVDYHNGAFMRIPKGNHGVAVTLLAKIKERNEIIVQEIKKMYREGRTVLAIGDNIRHLQVLEEMCWRAGIDKNHTGQFTRERYWYQEEHGTHQGKAAIIKHQKKSRVTDEYLDWVQRHARVIFATYGMMKEGTDIPRLDGGIDVTPRSEGTQVIGRIRRVFPGKMIPLWVTVRDTYHEGLLGYYRNRMDDYLKSGAELVK